MADTKYQIARHAVAWLKRQNGGKWHMPTLKNGIQPLPGTRNHYRRMRREIYDAVIRHRGCRANG